MLKYLVVFTCALVSGAIFTLFLSRASLKFNILKKDNIPLSGGPAVALSFLVSLFVAYFLFGFSIPNVLAIFAASILLLILGIIDDLRELTVLDKLLAQSFFAILLIISGIRTDIVYLGFWGNFLVTFFWFLAITNAFNLLDIMDGLAAGIALIISAGFLFIGFLTADFNVQVLSLILFASNAGFLIFNLPPARAYLGNSGSHFLGLLVACLALITHYASLNNAFALFSPVMILGMPVIDTLLLVIFRMIKGKPVLKKSRDHIALRIGALGFSPFKTIMIMYLLCAIFTACGVVLTKVNNFFAVILVCTVFLFTIGIFLKLFKIEADE